MGGMRSKARRSKVKVTNAYMLAFVPFGTLLSWVPHLTLQERRYANEIEVRGQQSQVERRLDISVGFLTLSPSSPATPGGPAGPGSPTGPCTPSRPVGPIGPFSPCRKQGKR